MTSSQYNGPTDSTTNAHTNRSIYSIVELYGNVSLKAQTWKSLINVSKMQFFPSSSAIVQLNSMDYRYIGRINFAMANGWWLPMVCIEKKEIDVSLRLRIKVHKLKEMGIECVVLSIVRTHCVQWTLFNEQCSYIKKSDIIQCHWLFGLNGYIH